MNHNERRDMPIIIGIAIAVLLAVIGGVLFLAGHHHDRRGSPVLIAVVLVAVLSDGHIC